MSVPSGQFSWDREATTILIYAYETHPNLYQTHHLDYKSKIRRSSSINEIKNTLMQNGYAVSIEEINKKIHGLRSQFFKEFAKEKKSHTSGSGTDDMYIIKWWCYDLLKFLSNSDPVRDSQSNIYFDDITKTIEKSQSPNVEVIFDGTVEELRDQTNQLNPVQPQNQVLSPLQKKKRKGSADNDTKALIQNASNILSNYSARDKAPCDELSAFGKLIEYELRQVLDPEVLRSVKRHILDDVYDAQVKSIEKDNKE